MSVEGIGEAVTGGLIAREVEPRTGNDGHTHESACLNCGTNLIGTYCYRCGQKGHVHRTLTAFWHDLVHGVLHFEGKVWRTLPLLAWRPGELTRRYIAGERARFVSPMALFLFSVFLMFAVFSILVGSIKTGGVNVAPAQALEAAQKDVAGDIAELKSDRAELVAENAPAVSIEALDKEIARNEKELDEVRSAARLVGAPGGQAKGETPPSNKFEAAFRKAKENPDLLLYKIQNNAYKFSWALIPISVPFVWLLFFWKRRYKVYDHTVFVTYSLCFMTLLGVVLSLLGRLGVHGAILGLAGSFIPPIHMYRQLRGAYELRRWSALLRTVLLVIFAWIAALIFILLLIGLGVLG